MPSGPRPRRRPTPPAPCAVRVRAGGAACGPLRSPILLAGTGRASHRLVAGALAAGRAALVHADAAVPAVGPLDVVVIAVPETGAPAAVEAAAAAQGPALGAGALVVLAGPWRPAGSGGLAAAVLELITGLRPGPDLALGYVLETGADGPVIVGGIDPESARRTALLYRELGIVVGDAARLGDGAFARRLLGCP